MHWLIPAIAAIFVAAIPSSIAPAEEPLRICTVTKARLEQLPNGTSCLDMQFANGEQQVLCDGPVSAKR